MRLGLGRIACCLVLFASPARVCAAEDLAAEERPAPLFRLPVYNADAVGHSTLGLERFVGPDAADPDVRAVLVSFSASFCGPCRKEMPFLQTLHERLSRYGLRVMMVSIDAEEEGQKQMASLISENQVTFPVLKDRFNLVARRWLGAQSPLPSVFLVRPDGRIAALHRGYSEEGSSLISSAVGKALGVDVTRELQPQAPAPAAPAEPASGPSPKSRPRKRGGDKTVKHAP